jgi:hypothetical protein
MSGGTGGELWKERERSETADRLHSYVRSEPRGAVDVGGGGKSNVRLDLTFGKDIYGEYGMGERIHSRATA